MRWITTGVMENCIASRGYNFMIIIKPSQEERYWGNPTSHICKFILSFAVYYQIIIKVNAALFFFIYHMPKHNNIRRWCPTRAAPPPIWIRFTNFKLLTWLFHDPSHSQLSFLPQKFSEMNARDYDYTALEYLLVIENNVRPPDVIRGDV